MDTLDSSTFNFLPFLKPSIYWCFKDPRNQHIELQILLSLT